MVRIYGRVIDYDGNPLPGTDVLVKDYSFDDLYKGITDEDGFYEIKVEKGVYYAVAVVKDYQVRFLEYWAWNVPAYEDIEVNACIGGLEVYAVNAFKPQGTYDSVMVYLRPMSLARYKALMGNRNGAADASTDRDTGGDARGAVQGTRSHRVLLTLPRS